MMLIPGWPCARAGRSGRPRRRWEWPGSAVAPLPDWRRQRPRRWRRCRPRFRSLRPAVSPAVFGVLDDQERQACFPQRLPDQAADAAVADQDGVTGERVAAVVRRGAAARLPDSVPAPRPPLSSVLAARLSSHGFIHSTPAKISGLRTIDRMAPARIRSRPCFRQQVQPDAELGQDEGEFADLREACRDHQRGRDRIAEGDHDDEGRKRLADDDDGQRRQDRPAIVEQARTDRTACRPRRRTARRRRRAAAAIPRRRDG